MTVSRHDWQAFVRRLSAVNAAAAAAMQAWMEANPAAGGAARIAAAYAIGTRYGEASAALACLMYDAIAAAEGLALPPALPAPTATYAETARAVRGTQINLQSTVPATVGRLAKQAGQDTIAQNALRDRAECAWIPAGDTCPYCLMLAGLGWRELGKKDLQGGHAEHIHANCDCSYMVRHSSGTRVAGYEPERYKAQLDEADPDGTTRAKINALRREQYRANADKINEQKRIAYARRRQAAGESGGGSASSGT
jgi:hypothetical protein